ncbi:MAG: CGNR zinc finger domain-containing protein [Solirubrobacteraceae bacterium]
MSICRVVDRFDAGTQPAGRPPAPGRLAFVQAFLNTFWDLDGDGGEVWSTPGAYGAWLEARGFDGAPTETDLERALDLRKALRALCLANHDAADVPEVLAVLDVIAADVAPGAALAPSLRSGALEPVGDGPDAACALALGIVFAARADGTFARLKACPHAHCGWAFYDSSRNRSGQWCSMRICGNRTKGEAFRRRRGSRRP